MAASEGQRLASAQTVIVLAAIVTAVGACIVAMRLRVPLVYLLLIGAILHTWAFATWVSVTDRYSDPELLPRLVELYVCIGIGGGLVLRAVPRFMLGLIVFLCVVAWTLLILAWPKLPQRDKPRYLAFSRYVKRHSLYAIGLLALATIVTYFAWTLSR